MEKLRILSYLPLFKGFYGSNFEPDEDYVIEEGFTYDDYVFDYDEYHNEVGKTLSNIIQEKIAEHLNSDIKIEFKEIVSPRYYNFDNDKIEVEFVLDNETKQSLYDKLYEHLDEFEGYLDREFNPRPGFIPFYSNKSIDWLKERDNHNFEDYNVISSIIEFLLCVHWAAPNEFYLEVQDQLPILHGTLIED